MNKISIVGGGLIGRAWSIVFARADYSVIIYEPEAKVASSTMSQLATNLDEMEACKLIEREQSRGILGRIEISQDLRASLHGATYVQECIPEVLADKQRLFSGIEQMVNDDVILASSTSTFAPSLLFEHCHLKRRCLVAHPVNPPYLVPLVEVVPSPDTAQETVDTVRTLMEAAGQMAITLKREIPGFVLNRLQVALVNEAISLVVNGVASMNDVDAAVKCGLGRRWTFMGPFETIDLNAPRGIRDYLTRFQDLYMLASEFKAMAPFSDEVLQLLEEERRETLGGENLQARAAWRDLQLMRVAKFHSTQSP